MQGLLNINPQDLQTQEYAPPQGQQQVMDYNPVPNIQQQMPQVVTYPQIHNIRYPAPTATVTSQGGPEIVPLRPKVSMFQHRQLQQIQDQKM